MTEYNDFAGIGVDWVHEEGHEDFCKFAKLRVVLRIACLLDVGNHRPVLRCVFELFDQVQILFVFFGYIEEIGDIGIERVVAMRLQKLLRMHKAHETSCPLEDGADHICSAISTILTLRPKVVLEVQNGHLVDQFWISVGRQ